MLLIALTLLACAKDGVLDSQADTQEEVDQVLLSASQYLRGSFSSQAQSEEFNSSYYHIDLFACRVDLPELGEEVMYVQQEQPGAAPYRQRLYTVESLGEAQAQTRVYTVDNEGDWEGFCTLGVTEPVAGTQWEERVGCGVLLNWDEDAGTFAGGTQGTDCETSLGGDYAASEVTLSATLLTSWDRGFNNDGSQEWGAVEGPYEFDRIGDAPTD